jgi:hypothetical protein
MLLLEIVLRLRGFPAVMPTEPEIKESSIE